MLLDVLVGQCVYLRTSHTVRTPLNDTLIIMHVEEYRDSALSLIHLVTHPLEICRVGFKLDQAVVQNLLVSVLPKNDLNMNKGLGLH